MSLQPGSRVGPYEILSRVGAGGMGEVFRARDTRLGRTVAVKVLPAQFANNRELRQRMQREARAISSLTHPHICALYDIGEETGVDYLVMEFLEGETLAERIAKGPLPLEDVLRYGTEIAEALEVAHREGIVHRDLKPGNIILTKSGAKLLDFGLARTAVDDAAVVADAPTKHAKDPLTAEGTIIGTFQYMAPEQLDGMPADARTDLFAFGAVLYETVTGRRAFDGKTRTSVIAAIVAGNPQPIASLRPIAPRGLDHVIQRCLDKDPDARWQNAHDVRLALDWIAKELGTAEVAAAARKPSKLPWLIAALAAVIAIGAGVAALRRARPSVAQRAVTAQILPPPGKDFINTIITLSISPDARFMTYVVGGDSKLWVRDIATGESHPIEGTERGTDPFWSPDSKSMAFFADEKLKKVALNGTPPVTIAEAARGRAGSWNQDDVILFSPTTLSGIYRVSAAGGKPTPVTQLDKAAQETTHRWATFLPDGKHFLYLAGTHSGAVNRDLDAIYVTSLDTPSKRTMLVRTRSNVAYANGHLLYEKNGLLLAHRFDLKSLRLVGEPSRIAAGVGFDPSYFRAAFAAAPDGTLLYRTARAPDALRFVWSNAGGTTREIMRLHHNAMDFRLSPDSRKAVMRAVDLQTGFGHMWIVDLLRRTTTRVSSDTRTNEWSAAWTPDSSRVLISRSEGFSGNAQKLVLLSAAGEAGEETIFEDKDSLVAFDVNDIAGDGYALLTVRNLKSEHGSPDVSRLALRPGSKPEPLVASEENECCATISPDGRWFAYVSEASGREEVYLARYPSGAAKTQVTFDGGYLASWPNQTELIIAMPDYRLQRMRLSFNGDSVRSEPAEPLFQASPNTLGIDTRDGKNFLNLVEDKNDYTRMITLQTGWGQ